MDTAVKKKIKHLDCAIAILTFVITVVFIAVALMSIILINEIFLKNGTL